MSEIVALRCDGQDCDVISMPWEGKVRSSRTPKASQKHRSKRLHYCEQHYPYEYCASCKKRLRPYQASAKNWPDTVAKHKSSPPLCSNCYVKGWSVIETKAKVDPAIAQAVRKLVVQHYQQSQADAWTGPAGEVLGLLGLD